METDTLKAIWASIIRKMAIEPLNRSLLLASNDVDTELQIRGDDLRYGEAKTEIDAYLRNMSAAITTLRQTDPDEWKRVTTDMTGDIECFMAQNKVLRLSRELSGHRLSTRLLGQESGEEPQGTAVRRERFADDHRDAGRRRVSFRHHAKPH
jgi:hypothetical protein